METVTMASLLTDLTSVFTSVIGQVATVATTIVGSPLLLLGVGMLFAGFVVGIFRRVLISA